MANNIGPLSSRQQDILGLLAQGYSDKEIAASLGIAASTARVHVYRALTKLGARSRTHAIALLLQPAADVADTDTESGKEMAAATAHTARAWRLLRPTDGHAASGHGREREESRPSHNPQHQDDSNPTFVNDCLAVEDQSEKTPPARRRRANSNFPNRR